MKRRELLKSAAVTGASILAAPMINRGHFALFADTPNRYSARTIELVGRSLVIDMLGLLTLDWQKLSRWQKTPNGFTEADFQNLKNSGISVFHPAVELPGADAFDNTLDWIGNWNAFLHKHRHQFSVISSAKDIDQTRQEGKIGILLGMQNSGHFRTIEDIALFHALGQRVSQLTYNLGNQIGNGCVVQHDQGVTAYGLAVIAEMNRIGMAIDVSHAGDQTTWDAFEASTRPVLITHSNCRALVPHPRCKPDSIIREMAKKGSVMGITGIRAFVTRGETATIEDTLNHFDHVARLVGVEHLGIGSDTDVEGRDRPHGRRSRLDAIGLNHPRRIFDLTEGLIRRRYTETSIELILGGNFRRVLSEVFA
jgi:membrane dipeptidase